MISSYLMGGLGNQLFQIFAAIAVSQHYETPFKFTYSTELTVGTHRPTYWDTLLSELKKYTAYDTNPHTTDQVNCIIHNFFVIKEKGFDYSLILLPPEYKNKNYILYGYYQSYHYFESKFAAICKMIKLTEKQDQIKEKCGHLFTSIKPIVSIHFRIGDYINIQDVHNILSMKYYAAAIKKMIDNIGTDILQFLYFYEKKDEETVKLSISVLKRMFPNCVFISVDQTLSDWEQMLLMSVCDHNIIANSTYSWWGAYFNQKENRQTIYPSKWFGPKLADKNTSDLFPDTWIKIEI